MSPPFDAQPDAPSYPFVGTRKNGRYQLCIPDLSLFVEGETIEEAHRRLEAETDALLNKYRLHGIGHLIPSPGSASRANEQAAAGAAKFTRAVCE